MEANDPPVSGDFYALGPVEQDAKARGIAPFDRDPDLILRSDCHPAVQNPPAFGEPGWSIRVPLEDGRLLELQLGAQGYMALRAMLIQETLDDDVDLIVREALEKRHARSADSGLDT